MPKIKEPEIKIEKTLDNDFNLSASRCIELKNNRHVDDIPLSDEYWIALKNHQLHHGGGK